MLEQFSDHGHGDEINVIDDESQTILITQKREELGICVWQNGRQTYLRSGYDPVLKIKKFYDQMTRNMINPDDLIEELRRTGKLKQDDDAIIGSYSKYCDLLKKDKMMDFAMIQARFYRLLEKDSEALEKIQSRFRFILIDEYQDTSPTQAKIFRKISKKFNNLFVVGDENQSIYGFRGASSKNFNKFASEYRAKKYFLDTNFRSTEKIVDLSNKVFEKEVRKALRSSRRKGEGFGLVKGETVDESAKKSVELIKNLKEENVIEKYGDVALLFRSSKLHSAEFVKYLSEEGIPFVTYKEGKLLNRPELRTVLWLMSYVTGYLDYVNKYGLWKEWWNPDVLASRFFDFHESTKKILREGKFAFSDSDFTESRFTNRKDIKVLKEIDRIKQDFMGPAKKSSSLLKMFYDLIHRSGCFDRLVNSKDAESEEMLHNLGRFSQIIGKYETLSKKNSMTDFLWQVDYMDKYGKIDQKQVEGGNTVKLMTVHSAKGLEFPVVFLCCMNEDRFPLKYKNDSVIKIPSEFLHENQEEGSAETHLEEERRLFYVGLTRAQDLLVFTKSDKIKSRKCKESRFLELVRKEISEKDFKIPVEKKYSVPKKVCRLSYSSINTFIDCPLNYALTYDYEFFSIDSIPKKIGGSIHNALQKIHERMKEKNDISYAEMEEIVNNSWIELPISREENRTRKRSTAEKAWIYYQKAKEDYSEIIGTEEKFSHISDNVVIEGRVDLIAENKRNEVNLIDFKSEKVYKDSAEKQLQLYNYCLENKYPIDKLSAYSFTKNEKTDFPIDKKSTEDLLKNVSEKIGEGNFPKKRNAFCKSCTFEPYCWGKSSEKNKGIFKNG